MIPKSFGLLFYLKKPRSYVKGERPIYLRITMDGVMKEMSIHRKCDPGCWDSRIGRAIIGKTSDLHPQAEDRHAVQNSNSTHGAADFG